MATDNLMPQSSASIIKHFMLRSSTTGQGLTGKVHSDFAGKYNIAGGAEVTLSFSSGTAGDAYSSGKICPLGLGKYAWHVPNAVFASLGNVSAVLSVTGGIDVHFEWLVVADSRDLATKPVNVTQFGGTNGTFASGVPDVKVASMAANALTAAAISADAGAELAALVETYIVNEGDATAVMQAIADKIAADWVAGDASPLAIASAVWAAGSRTITGGSLTTSPPTTAEILTALGTGSWATSLASQSSVTQIVNALPASGHLAGSADSNGAAVLDSAERAAIADEVESRELTLTAAYDAAKTAASQASVDNIPTNSELTTALAAADDAVLAAISALNNLSAAQVNAELLDVLSVDTFAELSAPPSASSSLKDKLVYLFMWARNKATQTTTERKLYADDGTTVVSTEAVSDVSGTFTKGEAS